MGIECANTGVTSTPDRGAMRCSPFGVEDLHPACDSGYTRCPTVSQLEFLPPLRPAAAFWARLPPLPLPLLWRLRLLPLLLPPRLDEPSELEIAAARDLLMPFLRRPSYCLSFFTLDP